MAHGICWVNAKLLLSVQADSVFITNQNQRSESREQIVQDIISGFPDEILDKNANKPWTGGFLQDPSRVSYTVRELFV